VAVRRFVATRRCPGPASSSTAETSRTGTHGRPRAESDPPRAGARLAPIETGPKAPGGHSPLTSHRRWLIRYSSVFRGIVQTCGSACHTTCRSPPSDPSGRSMSLPFLNQRAMPVSAGSAITPEHLGLGAGNVSSRSSAARPKPRPFLEAQATPTSPRGCQTQFPTLPILSPHGTRRRRTRTTPQALNPRRFPSTPHLRFCTFWRFWSKRFLSFDGISRCNPCISFQPESPENPCSRL
jgi:hypothetical protein